MISSESCFPFFRFRKGYAGRDVPNVANMPYMPYIPYIPYIPYSPLRKRRQNSNVASLHTPSFLSSLSLASICPLSFLPTYLSLPCNLLCMCMCEEAEPGNETTLDEPLV